MNVFLTGDTNVGKTTIIDRLLAEYRGSVGGFRTVRVKTDIDNYYGIYLLDIRERTKTLGLHNRAGSCKPDKSLISYEKVFETLGVKTLSSGDMPRLIVMDELGVLEENAPLFKQKVRDCLDADIDVLGVIKNRRSLFLNEIRNRKDVVVLEVDKQNNPSVYDRLTKIFL